MDGDRHLERLYERVTLVSSLGHRGRGQLCVMSFVALLAGEGHTDQPLSASPLIRGFAIAINDALPEAERQQLKPFAPRILGTNDGRDRDRAEVLHKVLSKRILPQVRRDRSAGQIAERGSLDWCLFGLGFQRDPEGEVGQILAQIERGAPRSRQVLLGSVIGELLAWCAREAVVPEQRAWYRNEALMLLDRLCDVGAKDRCGAVLEDRVAWVEERLDYTRPSGIRGLLLMLGRGSDRLQVGRSLEAPSSMGFLLRAGRHHTAVNPAPCRFMGPGFS